MQLSGPGRARKLQLRIPHHPLPCMAIYGLRCLSESGPPPAPPRCHQRSTSVRLSLLTSLSRENWTPHQHHTHSSSTSMLAADGGLMQFASLRRRLADNAAGIVGGVMPSTTKRGAELMRATQLPPPDLVGCILHSCSAVPRSQPAAAMPSSSHPLMSSTSLHLCATSTPMKPKPTS